MKFIAAEERKENYLHVLLIATGSVAAIKVPLMAQKLLTYDRVKVEVVATEAAINFIHMDEIQAAGSRVWTDSGDWTTWKKAGDPILHIELRRWADVVLVAPCSANTLAKIASGLCDNLATSILRALAPSTPTFIFPAMNTHMYEHPLTTRHLNIVSDVIGYTVIGPIGKALACGDIGMGAMTEWSDIVQLVVSRWSLVPKQSTSESSRTFIPAIVVEASTTQTQKQADLSAGIPSLEEIARDYPPMFTWDQVKDQVDSGPASPGSHTEPTYADNGSALGQSETVSVRPLTPSANNGKRWFTADIAEPLVKILPNDWPYSVPPEIRHYVVWSRLPITHPGIVPAQIWDRIVQDGLWGFSGSTYKPKGSGDESTDQLVRQAGAEVRTYVEDKWPAVEYEIAWFVNPPRLQSIPGLAHLHVFARKKSD
ncbi:hypothetical protein RhiTH_005378 [Rhizoctonia solani]